MAAAAKKPARMVLPPSKYTSQPKAPPKPAISLPGPWMLNTRVKAMHPAKAHRQGRIYCDHNSMKAILLYRMRPMPSPTAEPRAMPMAIRMAFAVRLRPE